MCNLLTRISFLCSPIERTLDEGRKPNRVGQKRTMGYKLLLLLLLVLVLLHMCFLSYFQTSVKPGFFPPLWVFRANSPGEALHTAAREARGG